MTTRSDWSEAMQPLAERYASAVQLAHTEITASVSANPDLVVFVARRASPGGPTRAGSVGVSKQAIDDFKEAALAQGMERLLKLVREGLPEWPGSGPAPVLDLFTTKGFAGPQE
ncbi:hypothetical protein [Deinococcus apachensis]|uniref:hypothetical protein n=1 Tax=Deinococcus apachensis TaxID=309886 RepID=UPI0003A391D3|nr:hypothetical protein [Deinococcus apachensis]